MSQPDEFAVSAALEPSDPLAQLNDGFLEYYAARQRVTLAELGPAVALIGDTLYLRMSGRRHVGPARTRLYHELKTICHVPLAIQAIVGDAGGSMNDTARANLIELRRRTLAVVDTLGERGLGPEQLARQRRLLAESLDFIAAVLDVDAVHPHALRAFLRAQMPDIRENIEEAARDQLQTMHATFGAWVKLMNPREWAQLRVVVGASHMSRTGNIAAQYFTLALGDRWAGRFQQEDEHAAKRVLVSEDAADEQAAFTLLATHAFDRRIDNAFFGEEGRMGRDVLADAAERLLPRLFGARAEPAA